MGKFGSFLNKARKNLSDNVKNYQAQKESDGAMAGAKKTILMVKIALAVIPVVFFGISVVIIIMVALAPVILITGVVGNVLETVGEFGSKVGNFFTSGCYDTDEVCDARKESEAEVKFFDEITKLYDKYYLNGDSKMTGELSFDGDSDPYNINQSGWERTAYSPIVNIPVLIATVMYEKAPTDGYYELLYGDNYISKIADIQNPTEVIGDNYLWYEDKNDIAGLDYEKILQKSETTADNPCGNYNDTIDKIMNHEQGYEGLVSYETPSENLFYSITDWFGLTSEYEVSKLRLIAKNIVNRNVKSECKVITKEDGSKDKDIKTYVTYDYNENEYKRFLREEYLTDVLKIKYYARKYEEWLSTKGYKIVDGNLLKSDGSNLNSAETSELKTSSEVYLKELQTKGYTPTEKEYNEAIDTILSASEYYEYILEELMNQRSGVVKVCTGVTVVENDEQKVYELEDLVAGFTTNLDNVYNKSTAIPSYISDAEAIVFRSYILEETEFCKKQIDIKNEENNPSLKYVTPSSQAKAAAENTRGRVLYVDDKAMSTYYTKFDYIKYDSLYTESLTKGSTIKLQDLESTANKLSATDRTAEKILASYFSKLGQVTLKRVTGNLIGGIYSSAAPSREGDNTDEIRGAIDPSGNKIYNDQASNLGQCVWYGYHRAKEILLYSDMDASMKAAALNALSSSGAGNGGSWNANNSRLDDFFAYSNNPNEPKAGSIITWVGGNSGCSSNYYTADGSTTRSGCGHIAIVEEVLPNGNLIISEGWRQQHTSPSGSYWDYSNGWGDVRVNYKHEITMQYVIQHSNQYFGGYVYLLG